MFLKQTIEKQLHALENLQVLLHIYNRIQNSMKFLIRRFQESLQELSNNARWKKQPV